MSGSLWLGLDPADPQADERHVEHLVLDLLHTVQVEADLVLTHVVTAAGSLPRNAASARLVGRAADVLEETTLARQLEVGWSGSSVLAGRSDGPVLETGPDEARAAARAALRQGRDGTAGRAVRFPGQDALHAPLPVSDVPLVSAVVEVLPVVGDVGAAAVLDTSGYVRPRLVDGRLVLHVVPGPGDTVVPVESLEVHVCGGH